MIGRSFLEVLRRVLPSRPKRWLKGLWNPHQPLSLHEALVRSARDVAALPPASRSANPGVSIIVVCYEGRKVLQLCLERLLVNTTEDDFEIIVVDNGSSDGSAACLSDLARKFPRIVPLLNQENRGFPAAVNQGIAASRGRVLVVLNHDVAVPRRWLEPLLWHLGRDAVGLVVPVTNFAGNEARIDVPYHDLDSMEEFADARRREHARQSFDIDVAAMYCGAFTRATYDRIGPLDEQFGLGLFEDDDYSYRVRAAVLRVVCAEDAFVHHFGQAAFARLPFGTYERLRRANRRLFERKWGIRWTPHRPRRS